MKLRENFNVVGLITHGFIESRLAKYTIVRHYFSSLLFKTKQGKFGD